MVKDLRYVKTKNANSLYLVINTINGTLKKVMEINI